MITVSRVFSGDLWGEDSEAETRREDDVEACLDLVLYFFGVISSLDDDISTSSSKNGEVS